jgi:hypothetical protein
MLNERNEIKSIENLTNTCKEILDSSCDFEISNTEPKQKENDNLIWEVPLIINVKFNKNIEQFKTHLLNSLRALSMSENEILEYKNLGKKTYKLAIEDNKNDKNKTPIYHFRSFSSVTTIMDLIFYTKHSVLNFEVDNGIYKVSGEKLASNQNLNNIGITPNQKAELANSIYTKLAAEETPNKNYNLKIPTQNLTPFLKTKYRGWGISGIFEETNRIIPSKYEPFVGQKEKMKEFKYQLFYKPEEIANLKFNSFIRLQKDLANENYYFGEENFYPQNRASLQRINPEAKGINDLNNDFQAIITLYDYKYDGTTVIEFAYGDLLQLNELEKIESYKISAKTKN